jgi:hypothetical protein
MTLAPCLFDKNHTRKPDLTTLAVTGLDLEYSVQRDRELLCWRGVPVARYPGGDVRNWMFVAAAGVDI